MGVDLNESVASVIEEYLVGRRMDWHLKRGEQTTIRAPWWACALLRGTTITTRLFVVSGEGPTRL